MCAIYSILNFEHADPVDRAVVENMTRTLVHCGPDDEGFVVEGQARLGFRRLSIIDLSGGRQPMFREDGSAAILLNGEIYSYRDLAVELSAAGPTFATKSDTETILHSSEQFGDDCVQRLRGMFAFAIWDRPRRRLLMARDRLGIKRVYYCRNGLFLAFGSEFKAFLDVSGARTSRVERQLNDISGGHFRTAGEATPLNRMLYVDAKVWLPDDLPLKADKMTMANSLELRVPFLDHKLVECSASLPDTSKVSAHGGKALLRAAMRPILPGRDSQPSLRRLYRSTRNLVAGTAAAVHQRPPAVFSIGLQFLAGSRRSNTGRRRTRTRAFRPFSGNSGSARISFLAFEFHRQQGTRRRTA